MLATYLAKRPSTKQRVLTSVLQKGSTPAQGAPLRHIPAAVNSMGVQFQAHSFATRTLLRQLNTNAQLKTQTIQQSHQTIAATETLRLNKEDRVDGRGQQTTLQQIRAQFEEYISQLDR